MVATLLFIFCFPIALVLMAEIAEYIFRPKKVRVKRDDRNDRMDR